MKFEGMFTPMVTYHLHGRGVVLSSLVVVHCSATQLCPALRCSMDCSTPGLPAPYHLL